MAQLYSTGPVDVWAGVSGAVGQRAPAFLGHGEKAPQIEEVASFNDVICDIGGGKTPFDRMWDGLIVRVSVELVRYNENVLQACQDRAVAILGAALPGLNTPGEIGTLMVAEGAAYKLWLRFPYAAKAFNSNAANGALPAGYRFVAASMDPDTITPGSSTPKKVRLQWTCLRIFDPTATNALGTGNLFCYDFDMTALPAAFN